MGATIQDDQFRSLVLADVFRRVWPRHATKHVARHTGSPLTTVRKWVEGTTEPRASDLIRLMAECDEVRAEVDRLVQEARACASR